MWRCGKGWQMDAEPKRIAARNSQRVFLNFDYQQKNHQCKALYSVASGLPAPSTCCFIATIPAPPYDYIITLRHAFLR